MKNLLLYFLSKAHRSSYFIHMYSFAAVHMYLNMFMYMYTCTYLNKLCSAGKHENKRIHTSYGHS